MSLFGLRPEEPAAIRIREAATRGTLSHALLLTGSGDRMSAACFAAAALECTGEESRPCGVCPACRKVLAGIHPDVITGTQTIRTSPWTWCAPSGQTPTSAPTRGGGRSMCFRTAPC